MVSLDDMKKEPAHVWVFTVIVGLSIFFHLFGFGGHIGSSYRDGQWGNQWVPFWGAFFGLILDFQCCYMLHHLWRRKQVQRKILWTVYCTWMFILALMIIIGDGLTSQRGEITGINGVLAIWCGTWLMMLFVIINAVWFEQIQNLCRPKISIDEENLPK